MRSTVASEPVLDSRTRSPGLTEFEEAQRDQLTPVSLQLEVRESLL